VDAASPITRPAVVPTRASSGLPSGRELCPGPPPAPPSQSGETRRSRGVRTGGELASEPPPSHGHDIRLWLFGRSLRQRKGLTDGCKELLAIPRRVAIHGRHGDLQDSGVVEVPLVLGIAQEHAEAGDGRRELQVGR
jgi:hypothetical protein